MSVMFKKVLRDNEQSGTHILTLGGEYLVYNTLIALHDQEGGGLILKDVVNMDKQDDGAAIWLFYTNALQACLAEHNTVDLHFRLTFVVHFIFDEYSHFVCPKMAHSYFYRQPF